MPPTGQGEPARRRAGLARIAAVAAAHPTATRWLLAGPGAALAALLFMAAMPVWLPTGASGIDHVVFPVILAPLIWAVAFTYACLEQRLPRGAAVLTMAIVVQGAVVALALTGGT